MKKTEGILIQDLENEDRGSTAIKSCNQRCFLLTSILFVYILPELR